MALVKIGFLVWLHGMKELVLDDFEFGKKEKEVNYLPKLHKIIQELCHHHEVRE